MCDDQPHFLSQISIFIGKWFLYWIQKSRSSRVHFSRSRSHWSCTPKLSWEILQVQKSNGKKTLHPVYFGSRQLDPDDLRSAQNRDIRARHLHDQVVFWHTTGKFILRINNKAFFCPSTYSLAQRMIRCFLLTFWQFCADDIKILKWPWWPSENKVGGRKSILAWISWRTVWNKSTTERLKNNDETEKREIWGKQKRKLQNIYIWLSLLKWKCCFILCFSFPECRIIGV